MKGKTLLKAALVCKKWNEICKSDIILRKRLRRHIRIEKRFYLHNLLRSKKDHLKRRSQNEPVITSITNNNKKRCVEGKLYYSFHFKCSSIFLE